MAAEASGWVYRCSPYKGIAFAIHLALADSANDQFNYELWARQEWIAEKARTTRPTVNTTLATMVEDGLLEILEESTGRRGPNRYRVVMDQREPVWTPNSSVGSHDTQVSAPVTSSVGSHDTQVSALMTQNPKGNPKGTQEKSADADVARLCELLAAKITERSGKTPKIGQRWHTDMRLLIERGPTEWAKPERIPPEKVARLVEYVFRHDDRNGTFCWADQVRSPDALRRHWEKLRVWANGHKQEDADDDTAWMASGATREELGLPLVERS